MFALNRSHAILKTYQVFCACTRCLAWMHAFARSLLAVQFTRIYGSAQIYGSARISYTACTLRTLEGQASACMHACVQCTLYFSRWISVLSTVDWSAHRSSNTNGLCRSCEDPPEACWSPRRGLYPALNARNICVWVATWDQRLFLLLEYAVAMYLLHFSGVWLLHFKL